MRTTGIYLVDVSAMTRTAHPNFLTHGRVERGTVWKPRGSGSPYDVEMGSLR